MPCEELAYGHTAAVFLFISQPTALPLPPSSQDGRKPPCSLNSWFQTFWPECSGYPETARLSRTCFGIGVSTLYIARLSIEIFFRLDTIGKKNKIKILFNCRRFNCQDVEQTCFQAQCSISPSFAGVNYCFQSDSAPGLICVNKLSYWSCMMQLVWLIAM